MSAPTLARPAAVGVLLPPESQPFVRRRFIVRDAGDAETIGITPWRVKLRIGPRCWECNSQHEMGAHFDGRDWLWKVDAQLYDADGFMVCNSCLMILGSPRCCDHGRWAKARFILQAQYLQDRDALGPWACAR